MGHCYSNECTVTSDAMNLLHHCQNVYAMLDHVVCKNPDKMAGWKRPREPVVIVFQIRFDVAIDVQVERVSNPSTPGRFSFRGNSFKPSNVID